MSGASGAWAATASLGSTWRRAIDGDGSFLGRVRTRGTIRASSLGRDSAYELLLTFALLFAVTTIVRWVIGPSAVSRQVPGIQSQLVIVGLTVGLFLAALILSPLGKASLGHMNPAISLAMWLFGVFPGAGVVPYSVAQFFGSVLGVIAARGVWGSAVAGPHVAYAVLQPAAG